MGTVAEWGVSALVVSGLVAALTLGRRRQQRRRGYRRRIAVPDDLAGRREWQAVTTPSAVDTATLDAALRGLALQDWSHQTAPDLTRVVLTADQAALHLADPDRPRRPRSSPGEDAVTWLLPGDAELPLDADEAGRYCAPYPLLVSVAADDDQLLLLDLEHLGYATVTGQRDTAVGLLRHIAAELANARWSEDVEILLVGFGAELPPLNTDRLRVLPDLAAALTELRVARRRIAATRGGDRCGRRGGPTCRAPRRTAGCRSCCWSPTSPAPTTRPVPSCTRSPTSRSNAGSPSSPTTPTSSAPTSTSPTTTRWSPQGAEPGGWRVETMTAAIAGGLADILAPTTAADLPAGPAEHPEPWAADMDADGALAGGALSDGALSDDTSSDAHRRPTTPPPTQLLRTDDAAADDAAGPAPVRLPPARRAVSRSARKPCVNWRSCSAKIPSWTMTWRPGSSRTHRGRWSGFWVSRTCARRANDRRSRVAWFTEILVYLALHPAGVSQNKVLTDLWPDTNQVAVGTVRTSLSGARRWAGRGLDGDPDRSFISDLNHDQTYRLRGHLLDFDLFRRLRKRAQARQAAHHPGAIARLPGRAAAGPRPGAVRAPPDRLCLVEQPRPTPRPADPRLPRRHRPRARRPRPHQRATPSWHAGPPKPRGRWTSTGSSTAR